MLTDRTIVWGGEWGAPGHSCPRASRERVDFRVVCPHWPNGFNGVFCNRNVFDSCMKSWYFRTDNISLESTFHHLCEDVLKFDVDARV